jgi:NTP pyrophosphatase (non-canonical NTP hydrolase)
MDRTPEQNTDAENARLAEMASIRTDLCYKRQFIARFADVASLVHQTARTNGWWDELRNPAELIALMHSELSEALEVLRKDPSALDDKIPQHRAVAVELADLIIRLMDMAEGFGYDVANALIAKAIYNTTRPPKHGKRF